MIQTQHQCLVEFFVGFVYNGKNICGKAFCAPCSASWGCEEFVHSYNYDLKFICNKLL